MSSRDPAWASSLRNTLGARRDAAIGAADDNALGLDASPVWTALSLAGTAVGAYHGYKRNDSVGWAIGWALLGGLFPIIVIPVAFAQGIDKRA